MKGGCTVTQPENNSTPLVLAFRKSHPCASLDELANLVSKESGKPPLTRERVRQILAKAQESTQALWYFTCLQCDTTFSRNRYQVHRKWMLEFCSKECRSAYSTVTLECNQCGAIITRKVWRVQHNIRRSGQKWVFCNRHCQGKYLAAHYGFGTWSGEKRQACIILSAKHRKEGKPHADR